MRTIINVFLSVLLGMVFSAHAATTDLADGPLVTGAGSGVHPNMMFILDDSLSMDMNFMPDYVGHNPPVPDGSTKIIKRYKCRPSAENSNGECYGPEESLAIPNEGGDPPFYSYAFNTIYYNPNIRYTPPINPCDTSKTLPSMQNPSQVLVYGHKMDDSCVQDNTVVDLTTSYPEIVYCKASSSGVTTSDCKRNKIDGANTYPYAGDYDYPDSTYKYARTRKTSPHYYEITPTEYCTNGDLFNCTAATSPQSGFSVPAYVRFCKDAASANAAPGDKTANANTLAKSACRAKFVDNAFEHARYGSFKRVDIVSGGVFPKGPARTDCVASGTSGTTCTYEEEITNFGNWYAYYRTRMMTMKSAAGHAFSSIDKSYRVGLVTIRPGDPVDESRYLPIKDFDDVHKPTWYKKLYAMNTNFSTPLREALSRVGRHYAGVTTGMNAGMAEDPVQYECQQNFALLTTDGYWNNFDNDRVYKPDNSQIGNQDNVNSGYSTSAVGAWDGGDAIGAINTLADVAMYYYKTDLRPGMANAVPTTDKDKAEHQHMVTFTVGLGLDGTLDYIPNYESATTGDFADIKAQNKTWPKPEASEPTALDDLWHAAVNGRGTYFSAKDPTSLAAGVKGALGSASVKTGAAAASATSSPNITPSDNFIYSSTYRTVHWDGEVVAKTIDTQTGEVSAGNVWSARSQLDVKGAAARKIYKMDMDAPPAREEFLWTNLNDTEKGYFTDKASLLSQWLLLDEPTQTIAKSGQNLLNFIRGDTTHENIGEIPTADKAYRDRQHLLGDTVNATPAFVKKPRFNFTEDGYKTWRDADSQKNRRGMLYIAANDGMLHALDASTGEEVWAYIPQIVMKDLYNLADKNYGAKHQYFVDGSPQVMDVYDGSNWRTILVGGLNHGGKGYFALDVTTPGSPEVLWEFCNNSSYCNQSDPNIGYTYGNPVIAKMPGSGKWVVMITSGYNNVSADGLSGDGKGYLYIRDAITGAKVETISTGEGSLSSPSGLAKISAWADNADMDATATHVYGGDLLGNVWRFDLTTKSAARLTTLAIGTTPQPITTKPELGKIKDIPDRIVFVGTGKYLGNTDLTDTSTQSIYAIRDTGATINSPRSTLMPRTISANGGTANVSGSAINWANGGWYADFGTKERVSIDPQLALGTLIVATSVPEGSTCSPGGYSWIYQFDFNTGLTVEGASSLGQKKNSGLIVGIVIFRLPNGQLKAVATTGDGSQDTFGVNVSGSAAGSKRTGWRELTR